MDLGQGGDHGPAAHGLDARVTKGRGAAREKMWWSGGVLRWHDRWFEVMSDGCGEERRSWGAGSGVGARQERKAATDLGGVLLAADEEIGRL